MAVSFLPQAQIRAGNTLLDLAQLNQGLASVQKSNELQADRALREQQMTAQNEQQNQLLELRRIAEARQAQQDQLANRRADETMSMRRAEFLAGQEEKARARQLEDDMRKLQEIEAGAAAAIDNPQIWPSIRQRYTDIDQDLPPEIAADPRATLNYIQRMRGGGSASYSKSAYIMNTPDGRQVMVQPSETGETKITDLGGLTQAKGIKVVGGQAIDASTARPVADLSGAIEGGEIAKGRGQTKAEIEKNQPKAKGTIQSFERKFGNVNTAIDKATGLISNMSTGVMGQLLRNLGGSDAMALRGQLDTIKANIGFQALEEMRANSPTGGALGNVTEKEINFLQSVVASLEQAQTPEQLKEALQLVRQDFQGSMQRMKDAYIETYGSLEGAPAAVRGAGGGGGTRQPPPPAPGTIMDGYEFIGGDPKDRNNWRLAQ